MQIFGVFESGQNAHKHFPEIFAKYYLVDGVFYAHFFAFFAKTRKYLKRYKYIVFSFIILTFATQLKIVGVFLFLTNQFSIMQKAKKSLVLLFLLSIGAQTAQAQDTLTKKSDKKSVKKNINYFTLYAGISLSNTGLGVSLESIFYKNKGVGITREMTAFVTPNYPKPYNGGWFGNNEPHSLVNFSTVSMIQKFSTIHQRIRFGTEIGVSLVELETPNFKYVESNSFSGGFSLGSPSGYRIADYITQKTTGIRLRASIDWLLTRSLGLELGAKANINSLHSNWGMDVKLTTGFLRRRIK